MAPFIFPILHLLNLFANSQPRFWLHAMGLTSESFASHSRDNKEIIFREIHGTGKNKEKKEAAVVAVKIEAIQNDRG